MDKIKTDELERLCENKTVTLVKVLLNFNYPSTDILMPVIVLLFFALTRNGVYKLLVIQNNTNQDQQDVRCKSISC